jgi:hypothetical protein
MSAMPDESVAYFTQALKHPQHVVELALEVQESRRLLDAIRALPDRADHSTSSYGAAAAIGYAAAMRQVKALLEGSDG